MPGLLAAHLCVRAARRTKRRGCQGPDAAVFCEVAGGRPLKLADPARGRFRTFLLTGLKNFLVSDWIKSKREKRGGEIKIVLLEAGGLCFGGGEVGDMAEVLELEAAEIFSVPCLFVTLVALA